MKTENCVHIPVLLNETIAALNPKPNVNFIDCTFGRGGHSLAILERTAPRGRILAIERDGESLNALPQELKEHPRIVFVGASYADLGEIVREKEFENVGGVLFDLGMSSWHLEESGKGFAFSRDEPLDMRYDRKSPLTAADVLNRFSAAELRDIFQNYGQERTAKKIAAAVERERKKKKIATAGQLAKIIEGETGARRWRAASARIFQALRIQVNREFEHIEKGIPAAFEIIGAGGRIAVITFHSGEDRIVKNIFRDFCRSGKAKTVYPKPMAPSEAEINQNPRARSAKLRVLEKVLAAEERNVKR